MLRKFAMFAGAAALGALLVVSAPDALAKSKKERVSMKVDNKPFKGNVKAGLVAYYDALQDQVVLNASYLKARPGYALTKNLTLACIADLDNAATTYPLTVQTIGCSYSEVGGGIGGTVTKGWAGTDTMSITINSYANGRINATFSGTIPAGPSVAADAVITKGKASLDVVAGQAPLK